MRYLAPAGAPIRMRDLVQWARVAAQSGDATEALARSMAARFGVSHAFVSSTGRAGLTLLLKAMRQMASVDRDEVVVPSYTCYSVAASIVKAGLRPRCVDIVPETLDFGPGLARTDMRRVLAVVATNLYGLPNDLPALRDLTRDRGVFLIDDAAQCMGASVGGRPSGTWGDAGLFSFDKGKNVSAVDGGVVVTGSDAVAGALTRQLEALPPAGLSAREIVKAVAYGLFLRPSLYGVPQRIPQLGLGTTVFTTDFPLARADRGLAALALSMLPRLEWFTEARVRNAAILIEGLAGVKGVRPIAPAVGATPVYLRLPVLFDAPAQRDAAVEALNAVGVGASRSYPGSLADIPELRDVWAASPDATCGRQVARRIATIPTHPYVDRADASRMLAVLRRTLGGEVAASPTRGSAEASRVS